MKYLSYIFIGISVILLIGILKILLVDIDRLTDYGWGYFTGRLILLCLFALAGYFFNKKSKRVHGKS